MLFRSDVETLVRREDSLYFEHLDHDEYISTAGFTIKTLLKLKAFSFSSKYETTADDVPKTFDFIESPLSILLDKRAFLRMEEGFFVIF